MFMVQISWSRSHGLDRRVRNAKTRVEGAIKLMAVARVVLETQRFIIVVSKFDCWLIKHESLPKINKLNRAFKRSEKRLLNWRRYT